MKTKAIYLGSTVAHEGKRIGIVTQIRPDIGNGQRFAFVQPYSPDEAERRLPVDELTRVEGV